MNKYYLSKLTCLLLERNNLDIAQTEVDITPLSDFQLKVDIICTKFHLPLLVTVFPSLQQRCLALLAKRYRPVVCTHYSEERFAAACAGLANRLPARIFTELHLLTTGKAGLQDARHCVLKPPRLNNNISRPAGRDFLTRLSIYENLPNVN